VTLVFTSDQSLCSQATELVVEWQGTGQVFTDRVKVELGSEVLGSSIVRAMSLKNRMYKNRLTS